MAASTVQLGYAARLWSPVLGCALQDGIVPDLTELRTGVTTPMRLNLPEPRGWRPGGEEELAALAYRMVVTCHLEPLGAGLPVKVAAGLLHGNAAAAMTGALRVLACTRPGLGRPARALAERLLGTGVLRGTGELTGPGLEFLRRSCCLFYRVPGGGLCSDCPLPEPPDNRRTGPTGAAMITAADLLLVNANVLTMDPARPRATAVAMAGGRIVGAATDTRTLASAERGHGPARADAVPGFHDAHNHMIGFGLSLPRSTSAGRQPRRALRARSPAEAATARGRVDRRRRATTRTRPARTRDRDVLDRVAPGRRVWLKHTSGHMCVVNSLVLADLGIDDGRAGRRRRPGRHRRRRPPHRAAGGARPGTRRQPDPPVPARRADRRGRPRPERGT